MMIKILFASLGIALLMPNHYMPWLAFHSDSIVLLALFSSYIFKSTKNRISKITFFIFLISLYPIVQYCFGQIYFFGDALVSFIYILALAISLHIGSSEENSEIMAEMLSYTFIISGLISVFISIHQWLELGKLAIFILDEAPSNRYYGNLAQPNQLATLLTLGIAGSVFLLTQKKISLPTYSIIIAMIMLGIVMTKSRTPFAQFFSIALAHLIIYGKTFAKKINIKSILPILIFGLIFYTQWKAANDYLLIPESTPTIRTESSSRIELWSNFLIAIKNKPLTGYGFNQITVAQLMNADSSIPLPVIFESAHNIILDLILYIGLPAALLIITPAFSNLISVSKSAQHSYEKFSIYCIAIFLTHAMLEFPLNYAYFLIPFGLFWGMVNKRKKSAIDSIYLNKALAGTTIIAFLLGAQLIYGYFYLEEKWRETQMQKFGFRLAEVTKTHPASLSHFYRALSYTRYESGSISSENFEDFKKITYRFGYASLLFNMARYQYENGNEDFKKYLDILCKVNSASICDDARHHFGM